MRSKWIRGWIAGGATLLAGLGFLYFSNLYPSGVTIAATLLPILGGLALVVGLVLISVGWHLLRTAQRYTQTQNNRAIHRHIQNTPRQLIAKSGRSDHAISPDGQINWAGQPTASLFDHLVDATPGMPEMLGRYISLGRAHYARNDKPKAADLLHRAITLYPEHKEGYRELAAFYIREGALERAMEYVAQAINVDPSARRDFLEDPLFDALRDAEQTHDWFERLLSPY